MLVLACRALWTALMCLEECYINNIWLISWFKIKEIKIKWRFTNIKMETDHIKIHNIIKYYKNISNNKWKLLLSWRHTQFVVFRGHWWSLFCRSNELRIKVMQKMMKTLSLLEGNEEAVLNDVSRKTWTSLCPLWEPAQPSSVTG